MSHNQKRKEVIMKNYLILFKNSKTGEKFTMVSTGSFDFVYKNAKSALRGFEPAVRKYVYIQSISEL